MNIYRGRLNKAEVLRLPDHERKFFCAIAHLQNEISILLRAVLWSSDFLSDNETEIQGQISISLFFVKLLAGKLREGWTIIEKFFFSHKSLSSDFLAHANPKQKEALEALSRYFGKGNVIHDVSTDFAFHYSPEDLDAVLGATPDELDLYIEEEGNTNSLYYCAEVLANRAALDRVNVPNGEEATDRFVGEVVTVAEKFTHFGQAFMSYVIKRQGQSIWQEPAKLVQFSRLPSFSEMRFPWFADTTDGLRRKKTEGI